MKKALQTFVLVPFAALGGALLSFCFLVGLSWEHLTCRKVAVIADSLYVKGAPIEIGQIEALMIRVYHAGSVFKLKLRDDRPFGVRPASDRELVAWAKRHAVKITLSGDRSAMRKYE